MKFCTDQSLIYGSFCAVNLGNAKTPSIFSYAINIRSEESEILERLLEFYTKQKKKNNCVNLLLILI